MTSLALLENTIISQLHDYCLLDFFLAQQQDPSILPHDTFESQCLAIKSRYLKDALLTAKETYMPNVTKKKEMQAFLASFTIRYEDVEYGPHNYDLLNQILREAGSALRIQWSRQGDYIECVCGYAEETSIDTSRVYTLYEECCSSHRLTIPMVAMIHHQDIVVRQQCIDAMIEWKWEPLKGGLFLQDSAFFAPRPEYYIGEYVRHKTMNLYQKSFDTHFKQDCITNVVFHECGHAVIQHHVLPHPLAAIAEAFQVFSDNICISFLEILADCAPQYKAQQGILFNALTEPNQSRKKQLLTMYFADIWFFDTEEESMFDYSEMMVVIYMKYIIDPTMHLQFLSDFAHKPGSVLAKLTAITETIVKSVTQSIGCHEVCFSATSTRSYEAHFFHAQDSLKSILDKKNRACKKALKVAQKESIKAFYEALGCEDWYLKNDKSRRKKLFSRLKATMMGDSRTNFFH